MCDREKDTVYCKKYCTICVRSVSDCCYKEKMVDIVFQN